MVRSNKPIVCGFTFLLCIGLASAARSDDINLVGGWNVTWDINSNPANSPSVQVQVQNSAVSSNHVFNGYDLGLTFELLSGAGQIALGNVSNPSSNSVVPAWLWDPPNGGAAMGTNTLYDVAFDSMDYSIPDWPTDLATVDFMPGAIEPAVGSVFEVWSDHNLSDYVDHLGDHTLYANNANSDFLLGTVTVVPEPSSIILLGAAGAGIVIGYMRRKFLHRAVK
jgi:hypothetical protein